MATTVCAVAEVFEGMTKKPEGPRVEMVPNQDGFGALTPSWVNFKYDVKDGKKNRRIGELAKAEFQNYPLETLFDAKRILGKQYDDPAI